MTAPFARIDFSKSSSDFRRVALEPGYPLLDRQGVNSRIIAKWLGRFVGMPECQGDRVNWFVRTEDGARLDDIECQMVDSRDLKGSLKGEFKDLRQRVEQAQGTTRAEKAVLRALTENFQEATAHSEHVDSEGYFLKYLDDKGRWRLVWAWGHQRVEEKENDARLCVNSECRSLFILRPEAEPKCPICGTKLPEKPSVWKRIAVILLLAILFGGGGGAAYWYMLPRATLTGAVVWEHDHQPVAGAEIRIAETEFAARTDETGRFQIDRLSEGSIQVEISAVGFQSQQLDQELAKGKETSLRVALTGTAALTGLVVNGVSQLPLSDAEVVIPGTELKTNSDDEGRFRVEGLRSGSIEFQVTRDGFPSCKTTADLNPDQETDVKVELTGEAILIGQVVEAVNEQPITGAKVAIADAGQSAETDETGWFALKQAPAGSVTIEVSADGFATEDRETILAAGKERNIPRVMMRGAANLTGDVVTAGDGKPVAGATVQVAETRFSAKTDEKGHFSLPGIRTGAAQISIQAEGYLSQKMDVMLQTGQETPITISLEGGAALVGTVVDSTTDKPVADAEVEIIGISKPVKADAAGKFQFPGIRGGTVRVEVRAPGFVTFEKAVELAVGEDTPLDVKLKGDAILSGTVMDAVTNMPVPEAVAQIAGTTLEAKADAKGSFRIEGLRSGEVEIHVSSSSYPAATVKQELESGGTTTVSIPLTGDAILKGSVFVLGVKATDATAPGPRKPVAGAAVSLLGSELKTTTGDDGNFQFDKLPAGSVTLKVAAAGFRAKEVKAKLSLGQSEEVEVPLGGDAAVSGEIVDLVTKRPVQNATITIEGTGLTAQTDNAGRFQLEDAFSGKAKINVSAPGYPPQTIEQELPSGSSAKVRVDLAGAAEVTGRIVTDDGEPIAEATVQIAGTDYGCQTSADGTFQLKNCRAGATDFEVFATNFARRIVPVELASDKPTAMGDVSLSSGLSISGSVINAINEDTVPDVVVSIDGTDITNTTSPRGTFALEAVPPRSLTVQFNAEGYYPETLTVDPLTNSRGLQVVLSPVLNPGEVRIVLTWGFAVPDLDIHLYGPSPDGQRFHVSHKKRQVQNVALDVDNRNGRGPETITLKQVIPGQYFIVAQVYQVIDEKDGEQEVLTIDRSEAVVKLYRYGSKEPVVAKMNPNVAEVMDGEVGPYTVWNVGEFEADANDVKVTMYGRLYYSEELRDLAN